MRLPLGPQLKNIEQESELEFRESIQNQMNDERRLREESDEKADKQRAIIFSATLSPHSVEPKSGRARTNSRGSPHIYAVNRQLLTLSVAVADLDISEFPHVPLTSLTRPCPRAGRTGTQCSYPGTAHRGYYGLLHR